MIFFNRYGVPYKPVTDSPSIHLVNLYKVRKLERYGYGIVMTIAHNWLLSGRLLNPKQMELRIS